MPAKVEEKPTKAAKKKVTKAAKKAKGSKKKTGGKAKKAKKKTAGDAKGSKKKTAKKKGSKKDLSFDDRLNAIRGRYERMPVAVYEDDKKLPRIPTRFLWLNRYLGGGIKPGAIVEIYGWEDSGKTSFALALAADVQAHASPKRRRVVMVNYEEHDDYVWWRVLDLDTGRSSFTQLQPRNLEEGMADLYDLCGSGEVCAAIVDSVVAADPKDSKDMMKSWKDPKKGGQAGAGGVAVAARQWGKAWRAVKGVFKEHGIVTFVVNQIREKPDIGGGAKRPAWAPPATTTPGGHALKFYAWVRLELRGSILTDEENKIRKDVDGRSVRVRVIKNKTSGDARGHCYYDLIRGFGWDMTGELIALAKECNAIHHKGGGHYTCGKHRIHGQAKLRAWVETYPRAREILTAIVNRWLSKQDVDEIDDEGLEALDEE